MTFPIFTRTDFKNGRSMISIHEISHITIEETGVSECFVPGPRPETLRLSAEETQRLLEIVSPFMIGGTRR